MCMYRLHRYEGTQRKRLALVQSLVRQRLLPVKDGSFPPHFVHIYVKTGEREGRGQRLNVLLMGPGATSVEVISTNSYVR